MSKTKSKKLEQIEWLWGLEGIQSQIEKYGEFDGSGIKINYYPTINEFSCIDAYDSYVDVLIVAMKKEMSFSMEELSKLNIAYKFNSDEKFYEMNFIHFIFNIVMWRPFVSSGIKVSEQDIFNPETFNNKVYANYFNRFAKFHCDNFTVAEYSEILHEIQVYFNRIAVEIGPIFGISLSVYDMIKMAKRNNEIRALLETEIDTVNFQVREVEEFLTKLTNRFFQILLNENDKNNPLKSFIRAGTGVNGGQVRQFFIGLGFKPDNNGETIPVTSSSSLLNEGMNTPESVFIDAKGSRKAAILSLGVADAGYFNRHQSFAASNITLNEDSTYSCDTVNLLSVKIHGEKELKLFDGRFYKVGDKKYRILTEDDKHLKGQTLEFRSPLTCANKEGKICKVCYGNLYNVNYGIHAGIYSAIDTGESKTQTGLSAKHLLQTKSSSVELIDEHMFLVDQNGWVFSLNGERNLKKYVLEIEPSDVDMESENNYDVYDNYYLSKLVFKNIETSERFEVYEAQNTKFYLGKQLYNKLVDEKFFSFANNEKLEIKLSSFSTKKPFIFVRITNEELTKPIQELSDFIQKGKKQFDDVQNYNDFVHKLNELYWYGGLAFPSVHIEIILRNLIRSSSDPLYVPDWSAPQTPEMYNIFSLNDSILLASSAILGFMFERVKKQYKDPITYRKTETSIYSNLFINN